MDYTPDHVGTGMYLRHDADLRVELMRRAEIGLQVARTLAPHRTGRLAASGHVVSGDLGMQLHHDRMVASVVFDMPYAAGATWPPGPDESSYLHAAIAAMEA